MLYQALSRVLAGVQKFFRADSAYSSMEIYNTCLNQKTHFETALKENVWNSILEKNKRNLKWQKKNDVFLIPRNVRLSLVSILSMDLPKVLT